MAFSAGTKNTSSTGECWTTAAWASPPCSTSACTSWTGSGRIRSDHAQGDLDAWVAERAPPPTAAAGEGRSTRLDWRLDLSREIGEFNLPLALSGSQRRRTPYERGGVLRGSALVVGMTRGS